MVKILVSYRRADSGAIAGRIHDRLLARYGAEAVFVDIDSIPYGKDFREIIAGFLRDADAMVALIGPNWRGVRPDGSVRIDETNDPVRVEIESALAGGTPIVPILIEPAIMPGEADLPASIKPLAFLNAVQLDSGRDFNVHMMRVIGALDGILAAAGKLKAAEPQRPALPRRLDGPLALAALAVAVCLALPVGAIWAQISPPWPRGVPLITVVIEAAAIGFAFQMLRASPPKTVRRTILSASVALAVLLSVYLVLVSYFTYETPTTKQLWAKGFTCTPEATLVYKDKCPDLGIDELKDAEYEAERLWTARSVTVIRVALVISWLASFSALAVLVGSLITQQMHRPPRDMES